MGWAWWVLLLVTRNGLGLGARQRGMRGSKALHQGLTTTWLYEHTSTYMPFRLYQPEEHKGERSSAADELLSRCISSSSALTVFDLSIGQSLRASAFST